jgi:hypothetical protein
MLSRSDETTGLSDNRIGEHMSTLVERLQTKHKLAVDQCYKADENRNKLITSLVRAEAKYLKAIKVVSRSQKRLNAARAAEKAAKKAPKDTAALALII